MADKHLMLLYVCLLYNTLKPSERSRGVLEDSRAGVSKLRPRMAVNVAQLKTVNLRKT